MSEFNTDDPLASVFRRYATEVRDTVRPATTVVHRAARRRRRARSTGIAVGVALAVGASSAGYAALAGPHSTAYPSGTGRPSGTGSPSQAGRTTTPSPLTMPTCPANVQPAQVPPSPGYTSDQKYNAPDTGPLYYLKLAGSGKIRLVTWTPGSPTVKTLVDLPAAAWGNANVAPDGSAVSWVDGTGNLHLTNLAGSHTDRVLRGGVASGFVEPVWSPDSTRLLIGDLASNRLATVSVASGEIHLLAPDLSAVQHAVWAADGSGFAVVETSGTVLVAKPDGTGQQRVRPNGRVFEGRRVIGLQSLSGIGSDGVASVFTIPQGVGDTGCRSLYSNTMMRAADGSFIMDFAQVGGDDLLFQAVFQEGAGKHVDRALTAPHTVELIGPNGEFLGASDEPAELADAVLLNA